MALVVAIEKKYKLIRNLEDHDKQSYCGYDSARINAYEVDAKCSGVILPMVAIFLVVKQPK